MPPILYGIIALLGQFKCRRRFADAIPITAILMLCWNAVDAPDNSSYRSAYENLEHEKYYRGFGIGFKFLINVSRHLEFDYRLFKLILVLITLLLTELVLIQLTENSWLVWSYYLIFPAIYTYIQIRNAFALAIVAVGLMFLVKHVKYREVYCVLLIVVACTIHSTCVLFLVIPLLFLLNERVVAIISGVVALLGFATMGVLPKLAGFVFPQKKIDFYMVDNAADPFDRVFIAITVLLNIGVLLYIHWRSEKDSIELDATLKISLAFLCLLPVLVYNKDFLRLDRVIALFMYVAMANYFMQYEQRLTDELPAPEAEGNTIATSGRMRIRYWGERFVAVLIPAYLFLYLVFPSITRLLPQVFGPFLMLG